MSYATDMAAQSGKPDSKRDAEKTKVLRMLATADIDRNRHLSRIEDCYKFALPWRHKSNQNQPVDQLDEIFDEELMTVVEDFAADMLNTFTPQKSAWVEPKPVEQLDAGAANQLSGPLSRYKDVIFSEMARSNLYQALQEAYLDLGPGTMALIVTDIDPAQPIHCEAIPCVDLLLNRGPYGRLIGKWRKRKRTGEEVMHMWPQARRGDGKPLEANDAYEYEVVDGCYQDLSARADETWHYVVMVGGDIVYRETYTGKGSCPFIVARWSRDSTTAWGVGPTYRTLPATKTLNHFRYLNLKNYDREVDPVVSYEDDGVMNVDHGINPGDWVGRAPGSKEPTVLESKSRMDVAVFNIDEVRTSIRRAHYQDRPEQQGKTPPTATQWADEAAERARRMGTPATNLVIELQYPLFERFAFLLAKRGKLPPVKLNNQTIALEPISPLLRAQEQEEVVRIDRYLEMMTLRFGPEMANIIIDGFTTAALLSRKMGIPPEVNRAPDQIAKAIQQLSPVLGGGAGGGAPAPGV